MDRLLDRSLGADYPWSIRWTFPEFPREGLAFAVVHNPLHEKWEPLPPFLRSLLQYVWKLFQIRGP